MSRPAEGEELIQSLTPRDTNLALPSLLSYASAATLLNGSLNQELRRTRDELARARMLLSVNGNLAVSSRPQTQATGLHPIDPRPTPPSPRRRQPQFSLPAPSTPRPGTYATVLGALARVRQQRQERHPILEGRPVNPREVGDVDTILRLSFTPPDASDHHAE